MEKLFSERRSHITRVPSRDKVYYFCEKGLGMKRSDLPPRFGVPKKVMCTWNASADKIYSRISKVALHHNSLDEEWVRNIKTRAHPGQDITIKKKALPIILLS
eukprot:scaffold1048_cov90-Amphora_coffeaeformis.AAC.23